jgi:erythromycin esterase-like protein
MAKDNVDSIARDLRELAQPITGAAGDYDGFLDFIGPARFVLLGEASHGTHEFYRERALITHRLIRDRGFRAIAVEADWPDAYRVHRYVRGQGGANGTADALAGFRRFPSWMWRNEDVLEFVEWLHRFNNGLESSEGKAGFYGLDVYSLYSSMQEVLRYLDKNDPEAARRARYRYSCFEHYGEDTQAYGYAASFGFSESCEREVVQQLMDMQKRAEALARRDGMAAEDEMFFAEQNARVVKNAEQYYRSMFQGRVWSWNLRDSHMMETLEAVLRHLDRAGGSTRCVLWAHNSHLGDARATEMGRMGEHNVGQLVRQRFGREAVLIGFSTYTGTVTAASDWDGPAERKRVSPGLPGSYEDLFHRVGLPQFWLDLKQPRVRELLSEPRLERAIGVVYRPQTERLSHYFEATQPDQFDAVLHFDRTRAVEPLERLPELQPHQELETFPTGV